MLQVGQCRLILAGLEPNSVTGNRGSQGVGIALTSAGVNAWTAAGEIVHNDLGVRVVAILKDSHTLPWVMLNRISGTNS